MTLENRQHFQFYMGYTNKKVMPMGLNNAPAIFQTAMNQILKTHILAGYCLVYLDDIIIKAETLEDHATHVDDI